MIRKVRRHESIIHHHRSFASGILERWTSGGGWQLSPPVLQDAPITPTGQSVYLSIYLSIYPLHHLSPNKIKNFFFLFHRSS